MHLIYCVLPTGRQTFVAPEQALLRPPGLPPDALLSLGALSQLSALSLSGAAATVDLAYVLSRLVGLSRLELGLLPAVWEAGGLRRREPRPLSLARLTALKSLTLRLLRPPLESAPSSYFGGTCGGSGAGGDGYRASVLAAAVGGDGAGATLPPELFTMLLTTPPRALELLQLDLPPPPRRWRPPPAATAGGAAAGAGAGAPFAAARLAPAALLCSPELLEALLREGCLSLRRLEALRLAAWRRWDGDATGARGGGGGLGRRPPGPVGGAVKVYGASRHLPEVLCRWALRRVVVQQQKLLQAQRPVDAVAELRGAHPPAAAVGPGLPGAGAHGRPGIAPGGGAVAAAAAAAAAAAMGVPEQVVPEQVLAMVETGEEGIARLAEAAGAAEEVGLAQLPRGGRMSVHVAIAEDELDMEVRWWGLLQSNPNEGECRRGVLGQQLRSGVAGWCLKRDSRGRGQVLAAVG